MRASAEILEALRHGVRADTDNTEETIGARADPALRDHSTHTVHVAPTIVAEQFDYATPIRVRHLGCHQVDPSGFQAGRFQDLSVARSVLPNEFVLVVGSIHLFHHSRRQPSPILVEHEFLMVVRADVRIAGCVCLWFHYVRTKSRSVGVVQEAIEQLGPLPIAGWDRQKDLWRLPALPQAQALADAGEHQLRDPLERPYAVLVPGAPRLE